MTERAEFRLKGRRRAAEPYRYLESGLDNVFLLNGFAIEKTTYGPVVTIDELNDLHCAIGLYIVHKPGPMSGAEFRFLRKQMELTQSQLAAIMNTTDQTIANYEKGKTADFGPADPFIRLTYLVYVAPEDTRAGVLKQMRDHFELPDISRRRIVRQWQISKKAA
jgi:DNA-binding transcriptional regulator YiaG